MKYLNEWWALVVISPRVFSKCTHGQWEVDLSRKKRLNYAALLVWLVNPQSDKRAVEVWQVWAAVTCNVDSTVPLFSYAVTVEFSWQSLLFFLIGITHTVTLSKKIFMYLWHVTHHDTGIVSDSGCSAELQRLSNSLILMVHRLEFREFICNHWQSFL